MRAVIEPSPSLPKLQRLFRTMLLAREVDRVERELVQRGLAFFHVSGAGHEALAVLADLLTPDDWLHLHYRDKSLLLARGLPIEEILRSLIGHLESHSSGRQMSAHLSAPHMRVLRTVGRFTFSASVGVILSDVVSRDAQP